MRWKWAAIVAMVVHVLVLAPMAGGGSYILDNIFRPDAEAVLDGAKPYAELDFEYPPLALPVLVAPSLVSEGFEGYREAFGWQMIGFDLAIVALLAWTARRSRRRVWGALIVYSAGLFALGGLSLARFDLVPAAAVLAAVAMRAEGRSAAWGALLGLGGAVKAFPLLVGPALLRGERRLHLAVLGAAVPLALAAGLVAGLGDEFGSAIAYHTGRDLQIEAVAATPFLVAGRLGAEVQTVFGSGSYNLEASGAGAAKLVSTLAMLAAWLAALILAWRRRLAPAAAAALVIAALTVLAPVLSPQFLLWMLPLSAAAFGLGLENLVLLAALALTRLTLETYDQVQVQGAGLVWPLAGRNALLLAYLALIFVRLGRGPRRKAP